MNRKTWISLTILLLAVSTAAGAQEIRQALENYQTTVTVYGERLPVKERKILNTAAPILVITRSDIQAMGAKDLQQVMETLPSVTLHNITGNPMESTVDLRGFPQGDSLAVFLDGVRLNDIQDNSVRWDIIPIQDVERIEVYPGASAPLYGAGALAGVVNIVTRHDPGIPRLDLQAKAGSFGRRGERLHTAGTVHNVEWYAAGETVQSDGWRENDGYRLDSALGRINVSLAHRQSLAFLVQYEGGREDDPGSLTAFELAANPRQSPFNLYDFTRGRHRLASLTYSWKPANGWSVSAQGYLRRQDRDTLTTGRFLSGFLARDREHLNGMILQAAKSGKSGPWSWTLSGAVEGNGGKLKARGFYTDFTGGNAVPATDTATTESGEGAYLNLDLGRGKSRFAVGFRRDRHRYTYEDHFNPIGGSQRVFLDNTLRLGYLYKTSRWSSAFVNYSEAYRIPSVVQLFAYPGFYSNPDLVPTRAYDWEAGWRYLKGAWRFSVDAFRMDMRNEVVFVLTQPQFFIGQSENVGRSYRKGVEFTAHMPLVKGLSAFLQGSYMDSVMTAGPNAGSRVPMVPRYQGAGGLQWLVRGLEIRLEGVTVGPERLDNDLANVQPGIPGYTVVNLSARWQYHALTLQASADNLLDRSYVSRGITNGATNYYTPAYPRSYRVSVMWSF